LLWLGGGTEEKEKCNFPKGQRSETCQKRPTFGGEKTVWRSNERECGERKEKARGTEKKQSYSAEEASRILKTGGHNIKKKKKKKR